MRVYCITLRHNSRSSVPDAPSRIASIASAMMFGGISALAHCICHVAEQGAPIEQHEVTKSPGHRSREQFACTIQYAGASRFVKPGKPYHHAIAWRWHRARGVLEVTASTSHLLLVALFSSRLGHAQFTEVLEGPSIAHRCPTLAVLTELDVNAHENSYSADDSAIVQQEDSLRRLARDTVSPLITTQPMVIRAPCDKMKGKVTVLPQAFEDWNVCYD